MRELEGRLSTLERYNAPPRIVRTFLQLEDSPTYFEEVTPGVAASPLYSEREISTLAADVIVKVVYDA